MTDAAAERIERLLTRIVDRLDALGPKPVSVDRQAMSAAYVRQCDELRARLSGLGIANSDYLLNQLMPDYADSLRRAADAVEKFCELRDRMKE